MPDIYYVHGLDYAISRSKSKRFQLVFFDSLQSISSSNIQSFYNSDSYFAVFKGKSALKWYKAGVLLNMLPKSFMIKIQGIFYKS